MKYIKSPFKFVGNKGRYLDQIIPLFPKDREVFIDLFTGSGTVAVNMAGEYKRIIMNDKNHLILETIKHMQKAGYSFIKLVEEVIDEYKLSNSYRDGLDKYREATGMSDSGEALTAYNKEPLKKLIEDFNKELFNTGFIDINLAVKFFVINIHSFHGEIYLTKKGQYNGHTGNRDFNKFSVKKCEDFIKCLTSADIVFTNKNFSTILASAFSSPLNSFVYADPPYLLTKANMNKDWAETDLDLLLERLYDFHLLGGKFALSECISYGDEENTILKEWINENKFNVHTIKTNYKNCAYNKVNKTKGTVEVLITNY